MQDVIFAGTPERKPLGMAEVTLTLVDPEAYEGPILVEPQVVVEPEGPADWDEEAVRQARANEVEEIIANEQPGQPLDEDGQDLSGTQSMGTGEGPQAVALKIRRREVPADAAKRRGGDYAPALPDRGERVPAERQALPFARHPRDFHGNRLGAGELRDDRSGADWAVA